MFLLIFSISEFDGFINLNYAFSENSFLWLLTVMKAFPSLNRSTLSNFVTVVLLSMLIFIYFASGCSLINFSNIYNIFFTHFISVAWFCQYFFQYLSVFVSIFYEFLIFFILFDNFIWSSLFTCLIFFLSLILHLTQKQRVLQMLVGSF